MKISHRLEVVVLLSILAAGCSERTYKLVGIPYCHVAEGQQRAGFTEDYRWIYRAGSGSGTGPLSGTHPGAGLGTADSVRGKELLLAVVRCETSTAAGGVNTLGSRAENLADEISETRLPEVCAGQKVLFHGKLAAHEDPKAQAAGYGGVMHFPPIAVKCRTGTVTMTTSEEIELGAKPGT